MKDRVCEHRHRQRLVYPLLCTPDGIFIHREQQPVNAGSGCMYTTATFRKRTSMLISRHAPFARYANTIRMVEYECRTQSEAGLGLLDGLLCEVLPAQDEAQAVRLHAPGRHGAAYLPRREDKTQTVRQMSRAGSGQPARWSESGSLQVTAVAGNERKQPSWRVRHLKYQDGLHHARPRQNVVRVAYLKEDAVYRAPEAHEGGRRRCRGAVGPRSSPPPSPSRSGCRCCRLIRQRHGRMDDVFAPQPPPVGAHIGAAPLFHKHPTIRGMLRVCLLPVYLRYISASRHSRHFGFETWRFGFETLKANDANLPVRAQRAAMHSVVLPDPLESACDPPRPRPPRRRSRPCRALQPGETLRVPSRS